MAENKAASILGKLAVTLSFTFLVIIGLFVYLYLTPLAKPMALIVDNPTAPQSVSGGDNQARDDAPKQQVVCGNSGSMLLLLTGEDFNQGTWPLGADTIRVVKVDFSYKKLVIVGFPRDLWVKTPGLASQNYPETRLGLSYHYKKESTNGSDRHKIMIATGQIAQALYDNFGLAPEKYFTIQLQNTQAMVDTIGGLDIDVPAAFTSEYGVSFAAGPQHMDGAAAVEYVRAWAEDDTAGDLLRFPRQNMLVKALHDKLLSAGLITKVPALYKQFDKAIVTDLSPRQVADLACLAKEVPQENIEFHQIVGDLVTEQDGYILMPKVEKIKAALKEWLDL
jgi:LCP family protein required for cell wall assembly